MRYADDFVIIAKTKEQAEEIKDYRKDDPQRYRVSLSAEKTRIERLAKASIFLDFTSGNTETKLLINALKANILRLKKKVSDTVKGLTFTQAVVATLRPIIYGWGN